MSNDKAITVGGYDLASCKSEPVKVGFFGSLVEKARSLVRGEPEKSLIEKGITDTTDSLTVRGEDLFIDYLYRTNKDAFVKDPAVAALLAEKDNNDK